jgi:hypothetical protein
MLEGVEEARHFNELYRPIQVMGQPELLEVSYVSEIPEDGTHERIVLRLELLIRQRRDEQEGPGSGLEELPSNGVGINPARRSDRGHEISGTITYDMADFAGPRG